MLNSTDEMVKGPWGPAGAPCGVNDNTVGLTGGREARGTPEKCAPQEEWQGRACRRLRLGPLQNGEKRFGLTADQMSGRGHRRLRLSLRRPPGARSSELGTGAARSPAPGQPLPEVVSCMSPIHLGLSTVFHDMRKDSTTHTTTKTAEYTTFLASVFGYSFVLKYNV